jgi:hypothetical protein
VTPFGEGGDGKDLSGGHDPLAASTVNSNLKHDSLSSALDERTASDESSTERT